MPDSTTGKTSKAAMGYQYCNKLFTLEKKCANQKAKYRQNIILPVLEEYFCWLDTLDPETGSKLEKVVRYSRNQKRQLTAFLEHGDVPISNNLAENAIRPFVVGRKNWLFYDTVEGAESSAIVYPLVEMAKAIKIDPYDYLFHTLSVLPHFGKSPSHERLETLMPWAHAVQQRYNEKLQPGTE